MSNVVFSSHELKNANDHSEINTIDSFKLFQINDGADQQDDEIDVKPSDAISYSVGKNMKKPSSNLLRRRLLKDVYERCFSLKLLNFLAINPDRADDSIFHIIIAQT